MNLTGTFLMSKVFGAKLIEAGRGGSIVNISSIAGKRLPPNTAAYASSKAGIQALTACMAQEVGRLRHPGQRHLPGHHRHLPHGRPGPGRASGMQYIKESVPLGRPGQGEDIAWSVVYLCSDQGAWVTGQSWNVDGGHVVQH